MRKHVLALFVAALFLVTAAVSAQDGLPPLGADQDVTITFYSYNLASAGIGAAGTEQLISEFEELHPNIHVEGVGVPATEVVSRTQADLAAGNPPDVAQLIFNDLDFVINNFGATPLEQIVPVDEWAAHVEGFHPRGLPLGQQNGLTYGMAFTFSTPVLYINTTILEEAGIDPTTVPTTWDEVEELALQVVANTDKQGVSIYQQSWIAQALVMSNGGRMLSEDRTTLMFGEEAGQGAMARLQAMVNSGAHVPAGVEAFQAFAGGQVAMMLNTTAALRFVQDSFAQTGQVLNMGMMPSYGDLPTVPVNSGSALFILSQDPLKQRAAWDFIKFVTSERGYTIITSQIGYLPLRPAIVNDPEYLGTWIAENPLYLPNLEQLDSLTPWVSFPGPNYRQIEQIITEAQTNVIFNNADPATLMDAQVRAQALMPQ
ncbi:MAG: ABC transporter substrate-binding protein [Anaerolineae bacterium]|uniref:ABC transporter substrate-binding protein n=1 Tax=Candidatus Flexifilum breve TaxID=3140694 RepID=UPI001ACF33F3|nr:ABC transporter substrate-binding protein [Chloroflexota bacterium]MBK9747544.1 ABC transporter substrate-binding protein [Chloroflexota bacterium]MBN8635174.1 ABC transporter substrate-binding protein [Anaerolineae bacterium]